MITRFKPFTHFGFKACNKDRPLFSEIAKPAKPELMTPIIHNTYNVLMINSYVLFSFSPIRKLIPM